MNTASVFDHMGIIVGVALLSMPVYFQIGRMFFNDWNDFLEHLRMWFQPFWLSMLRGEFELDMWQQTKLLIYLLVCVAWVFGISTMIVRVLY